MLRKGTLLHKGQIKDRLQPRWTTSLDPGLSTDQLELISTLWDEVANNPPGLGALVLIMDQYRVAGIKDMAKDIALQVCIIDPENIEAKHCLVELDSTSKSRTKPQNYSSKVTGNASSSKWAESSTTTGKGRPNKRRHIPPPKDVQNSAGMETVLKKGYPAAMADAVLLSQDLQLAYNLINHPEANSKPIEWEDWEDWQRKLKAIAEGRVQAAIQQPPASVLSVARMIEEESKDGHAVEATTEDLEGYVQWMLQENSTETVRDLVAKRVISLTAALSENLHHVPIAAMQHVEHELLGRTYLNDETMLQDPVSKIPRAHFWSSEDGYAWDMEELADCLMANGGVMRNPLSKQPFSVKDVTAIINHPLGRKLAAAQVDQKEMAQGVRQATVQQLATLSATLLADQSAEQAPSRAALDAFLQHIATLPPKEQRALDELRVPAVDSHSGQPFDCTIGDTVRDALANKTCMHKAGDLLNQASKYLSKAQ